MSIYIRDAMAEDYEDWLVLWQGYLRFYEADVPDAVTQVTWNRILDPVVPVSMRLAIRNLDVAGFAICHRQITTWSIQPIVYLEDLFVNPEFRGEGIGTMLIDDGIERARKDGAWEFFWQTREGNAKARSIYDVYTKANDFVTYRITL